MKNINKVLKVFSYTLLSICFVTTAFFLLFHFGLLTNFSTIKYDKTKLIYAPNQVKMFDASLTQISSNNNQVKNLTYKEIPQNLISAFVSIEDKQFFSHKGVNYKRILGATLKNIKSKSFKEGASTITQQLVKNTHLTNEKTISRKVNELLLAQKVEQNLSKEEIITAYLNAIYFGNGAFGINQASQRYFSKPVENLTLAEMATLAGIVKSPKKYSPITNYDNCINRRNLVLLEMLKDKKITKDEYEKSKNEKLNLIINKSFLGNNNYYSATVDEACKILKITEKDLILKGYEIYTYKNNDIQKLIDNEVNNALKYTNNLETDMAVLSVDNSTGGITGFGGKSDFDLLSIKLEPGSILKPIITYAPAFEYNIASPSTPIFDEKVKIKNYSPKNYNNVYHGWISTKEALAKSLNIPSIKLLQYVGIEKAKIFANKMGINFDEKDVGYSLALGGLTNGIKLKEITNCYQCFANNGKMNKLTFIKEIKTKNGRLIYKNNEYGEQVIKNSTAFLVTDCLKESVKNGTAKKLNLPEMEIASKTGTVGVSNSKNNKAVWNISYTPSSTLCVWFGKTNLETLPQNITGANTPTFLAQNIYKNIPKNISYNKNFIKPESVEEVEISLIDYQDNKVVLANSSMPDRYKKRCYFSKNNIPKETSNLFEQTSSLNISAVKNGNNEVEISFKANSFMWYEVIRESEDNKITLYTINNTNDNIVLKDSSLKSGNFYTYYVISHFNQNNNKLLSSSNQVKIFAS